MKEYRNLKPEDLVEDPAFRAWVYYETADTEWRTWLKDNPQHQQSVEAARSVLLSVRGELDRLPVSEVKDEVRKLMNTLHSREDPPSGDTPPIFFGTLQWRTIAAAFVLMACLGAIIYLQQKSDRTIDSRELATEAAELFTEVYNDTQSQKLVNLPDGSSVLLMSASTIVFPKIFNPEKREVTLSGEAFFEVQKDASHPFFVYAGEMVTRVVGTSFTVKAYEGDEIVSVRVKSGKVSVSTRARVPGDPAETGEKVEEIILQPNQQAVLSRSDWKIALLEESQPQVIALPIEHQTFEFRRTQVSVVLETLKTTYAVDIRYDAAVLQNCSITASLGDEPLMEKLNMICEAIGANYSVDDNQVVHIRSTGCD